MRITSSTEVKKMATFMKNDKAFTGLEAAIVLIAFVVVAAVFSYVVLGAGFFTTQKSQEVIHTSMQQASSSMEIIGNVYGIASSTGHLNYIKFTIGNTAGGTELDVSKMVVSYADETSRESDAVYQEEFGAELVTNLITSSNNEGQMTKVLHWGVIEKINADTDTLLEPGEQFVIGVAVPKTTIVNKPFQVNLQPAVGAVFSVSRSVPAGLDTINILY